MIHMMPNFLLHCSSETKQVKWPILPLKCTLFYKAQKKKPVIVFYFISFSVWSKTINVINKLQYKNKVKSSSLAYNQNEGPRQELVSPLPYCKTLLVAAHGFMDIGGIMLLLSPWNNDLQTRNL